MLTVEKVLEIFDDYLKEDTACEIIKTSRAYIIGMWDDRCEEYEFLETYTCSEDMKNRLLAEFEQFLIYKFTKAMRDELTNEEQIYVDTEVKKMIAKLEQ